MNTPSPEEGLQERDPWGPQGEGVHLQVTESWVVLELVQGSGMVGSIVCSN